MYSRSAKPESSGNHLEEVGRGGYLAFGGGPERRVYTAMRLLGIGPVGTLVASGKLSARDKLIVADLPITPVIDAQAVGHRGFPDRHRPVASGLGHWQLSRQ